MKAVSGRRGRRAARGVIGPQNDGTQQMARMWAYSGTCRYEKSTPTESAQLHQWGDASLLLTDRSPEISHGKGWRDFECALGTSAPRGALRHLSPLSRGEKRNVRFACETAQRNNRSHAERIEDLSWICPNQKVGCTADKTSMIHFMLTQPQSPMWCPTPFGA